jgi:hypothetical protein
MPFTAPDERSAQPDRLREWMDKLEAQALQQRRWTYTMIAAAVAVMVLSVLAVVFIKSLFGGTPATPAANETKKDNKDAEPAPANANIKPADKVADPAAAKAKGIFLEALGGLSAIHLYQTHLNIGLLADNVESKAYTVDDAKKRLNLVMGFVDSVEEKLTKVEKAGLDADDVEALQDIKAMTGLLRLEAQTLASYWTDGTKEQADQYQQARKAANTGLAKALGLDAKEIN